MNDFMKYIEERWNKLSKDAQKQFWNGIDGSFDLIKDADAYQLAKEVYDWENKIKEEQKMQDKEEGVKAEVVDEKSQISKDLAIVKKRDALLVRKEMTVEEMKLEAELLWKSGYFTDIGSVAQAFAKVKAGNELGFPAFYSLNNFVVVPGKPPGGNGQVAGALIKRSGYDYRVKEWTNDKCTIDFYGFKGEIIGTHTVTYEEASKIIVKSHKYGDKRLVDRNTWRSYRKLMLCWRTLAQGARIFCPDALAGLYLVDAEGEVYADVEVKVNESSDLSQFDVEVAEGKNKKDKSKAVEAEVISNSEKIRKDLIDELVQKYGQSRVREVRNKLKIKKLSEATDEEFKEVERTLKMLNDIKNKFKDNEDKEMTVEEKRKQLKQFKKDFGEDKINEVKQDMKIKDKLINLDDKTFKKFAKRIKSK